LTGWRTATLTFAGTAHRNYWAALYSEIENGGAAAMFCDLLNMDLTNFDVRAMPHTAAKAEQQAHSLQGTEAWLYHVLQDGRIGFGNNWEQTGLMVSKDIAYRTVTRGWARPIRNANKPFGAATAVEAGNTGG
jgi:hypothetical protein